LIFLLIFSSNIALADNHGLEGSKIKITAYSPVGKQTDKTPNVTASSLKLKKGQHDRKIIALSHDLAKKHDFGDKFKLIIDGEVYNVEFQDLMNKRFRKRADLLLYDTKLAKEFGIKEGILIKKD
jgi:hypothetical protein